MMGKRHRSIDNKRPLRQMMERRQVAVKQWAMFRAWILLSWPFCGTLELKKQHFGFSWLWCRTMIYAACLKLQICMGWRCVPSQSFSWFIKRCQTFQHIWQNTCRIRWVCFSQIGCSLCVLVVCLWCHFHIFGITFLIRDILSSTAWYWHVWDVYAPGSLVRLTLVLWCIWWKMHMWISWGLTTSRVPDLLVSQPLSPRKCLPALGGRLPSSQSPPGARTCFAAWCGRGMVHHGGAPCPRSWEIPGSVRMSHVRNRVNLVNRVPESHSAKVVKVLEVKTALHGRSWLQSICRRKWLTLQEPHTMSECWRHLCSAQSLLKSICGRTMPSCLPS